VRGPRTGERSKVPSEAPAVGGLLSRPVHVPELFLCPLGLALQVHTFRLRPPLYGVAILGLLPLVQIP
jgi:hypothetical protein